MYTSSLLMRYYRIVLQGLGRYTEPRCTIVSKGRRIIFFYSILILKLYGRDGKMEPLSFISLARRKLCRW